MEGSQLPDRDRLTQPDPSQPRTTLYAAREADLRAGLAALDRVGGVRVAESWDELREAGPACECAVVLMPTLSSRTDRLRLVALTAEFPALPVVLVTGSDPNNLRHLKDLLVQEVIWVEEAPTELARAVFRARTQRHALQTAQRIQTCPYLSNDLREALLFACHARPPIVSVNQLCTVLGINRRTLWRRWKEAAGDQELRLQDFLAWLLLLRAIGNRPRSGAWSSVAEDLGVHPQTLAKTARRLTDDTLSGISSQLGPTVWARFEERMLTPLLGPPRHDLLHPGTNSD